MLSPLRNRFGIPGVISVIALVFAMLGGAYAASDNGGSGKPKASASAKKGPRGPRGPKGPAGPPGPAGTAGAQGPAGAKGDTGSAGTNGSNGTNGTNGTSATVASFAGSKGTCTEGQGGLEVKSASPTAFVCNGKNGTTGFTETLPSGKTETGAWLMQDEGELSLTSISFPIPLPAPMVNEKFVYMNVGEAAKPGCTGGTANAPKADPGFLCVYLTKGEVVLLVGSNAGTGSSADIGTTGANLLGLEITEDPGALYVGGTWAVTAP